MFEFEIDTEILTDGEFANGKNFMLLQYTSGKTPRGFLIKDKVFIDSFTGIFNRLWSQAKP